MCWLVGEPTLDDALSDPVVHAILKRDGVSVDGLRRFLEQAAKLLWTVPNVGETCQASAHPPAPLSSHLRSTRG
jgi:hypothetical protein